MSCRFQFSPMVSMFHLLSSDSHQFTQSCLTVQPHGLQHTRLPCPSLFPGTCWNSCPSGWWCHATISSSVIPFSSCLQSFPASGSSPMSQFLTPGGQSIGVSFSASVLPMNIQDWFPLGLSRLTSLQSEGLSKSSPAPQFKSIKDDKHYSQNWTAFWMATWPISLEFSLLSSQVPCVVCVSHSVMSQSLQPHGL